jgi:hypothetical protein
MAPKQLYWKKLRIMITQLIELLNIIKPVTIGASQEQRNLDLREFVDRDV